MAITFYITGILAFVGIIISLVTKWLPIVLIFGIIGLFIDLFKHFYFDSVATA